MARLRGESHPRSKLTTEQVLQIRELITLIETRGHYYESEAEVLNMIGEEYNHWKRKNR